MPSAASRGITNRSERRIAFLHTQALKWVPHLLAPLRPTSNIGLRSSHLGETMRYISRGSAMVMALLVLGVSVVSAQHPQTRQGFWIGFGFGYGSYTCTGCGSTGG